MTKTYIVRVEGDERLLPSIEQGLKAMADVAFDLADPDDVGMTEDEFIAAIEAASVEVTDAEGNIIG